MYLVNCAQWFWCVREKFSSAMEERREKWIGARLAIRFFRFFRQVGSQSEIVRRF